MADKKPAASGRLGVKRKEKAPGAEAKKEVKKKEVKKEEKPPVKEDKMEVEEEAPAGEAAAANGAAAKGAAANGAAAKGAAANGEDQLEVFELPPWEIITGDRINPFFFKFQFKNVEYSSGRNKTFLCYLVDQGREGLMRGYLEDEHSGAHAELAFFMQTLPEYDSTIKYTVTWYVSSSPCAACALKLADVLNTRKSLKLTIFSSRLFEWEEPEIQTGLKALAAAGCKLRVMKPLDFRYTWDTFVEQEDEEEFNLWEDCQDNYEYYQEKLAEIVGM